MPPTDATGISFHHDPVRSRERAWDRDAGPLLYGSSSQAREVRPGRPAFIATGTAAPAVR